MPQSLKMTRRDWLLLIALSLLWGGSFFFVELVVGRLPPLLIAWLRVTLAAGVLAGVLGILRLPFPSGWAAWRALVVMGLINNVLPFSLFVLAQTQISSSMAAILNATTPLFALIVAHLVTGDERMGAAKLCGVGLGFAGVAVMMRPEATAPATLLAQAACLAAALCYGLATVWGRRFRTMGVAPLATAFGMLASSSVLLLPAALWGRPWALPLPGGTVIGAILALAVLSTALAYLIYFRLLASAGAVNLALVTFLIPVSAIGLGVLVLGERLGLAHFAGLALILIGLAAIDGRLTRR